MNKKVAGMISEIERRGGVIGMSSDLPDDVAESFLAEILDCPDCRAEASRNGLTSPDPEPRRPRRQKTKGH